MDKAPTRESFASKFGFFAAISSVIGGVGVMVAFGFRAIAWGGGAFWFWYMFLFMLVAVPGFIADSTLGLTVRKAYPQTWRKITNGNKLFVFFAWFVVTINFLFAFDYVVTISAWLQYLVLTPFKGWGSDPGGYFWNTYGMSGLGIAWVIGLWAFYWVVTYKSVNKWAKVMLWNRPFSCAMLIIVLFWTISSVPNFLQGWATTFDFRPENLLSATVITQAMFWVMFRTGIGNGGGNVFASYLPRGGDVVDSIVLSGVWDIIIVVLGAMALVPLILGTGIPPLFSGSMGLAFSALPKAWSTLQGGLVIGMLFYAIVIPAGLPIVLGAFENAAAAFMDEFGLTRTRVINVLVVLGLIGSICYSIPIWDAVNGESWGWTLTFTTLYFQTLGYFICTILLYVIIFKYFKPNQVIEVANASSALKLPKTAFKYILYLGFLVSAVIFLFFIGSTTGLVPGIKAGDAGTLLGDGTAFYGLTSPGLALIFINMGIPAIVAALLTFRRGGKQ
ncbi:MAG: hypothetical protein WB661_09915 [Candidatus Bathyarchaeia archaeon]